MFVNNRRKFGAFLAAENQSESDLNRATREYFSKTINTKHLVRRKQPEANLKSKYRKTFEVSFAITLVLLIVAVQMGRQFYLEAATVEQVDVQIEVADIPKTQQFKKPPPPARPSVPIPTESESVPEDVTITSTEIDLSDIPPPPGPPEEDGEHQIFVAYDEPPKIIGGMAALQKHLRYPRLAQAAGVEGIVFVKILISPSGVTERAEVLKAKPAGMGFEEAAINAVKKVKWHPAKQRDKKIRVWVSIPVQFQLVS
ncbi:energy transducer TonB [candidate division KSB1 bacterium]|nr:energy transducer TonB [candidate division KSB1 bacterium]NIR71711.1 energy transducer TonB [candidate division KSB1 bacterium]NIS28258.1 energy transducer TonB [candidate division KSB1 bacterium]NIT70388.1 energy transducer TonB [candidate division KSB1 bacterium]NIU28936.1 energy transducer TonB [candidate division KSB1 bacterium]